MAVLGGAVQEVEHLLDLSLRVARECDRRAIHVGEGVDHDTDELAALRGVDALLEGVQGNPRGSRFRLEWGVRDTIDIADARPLHTVRITVQLPRRELVTSLIGQSRIVQRRIDIAGPLVVDATGLVRNEDTR